jgi:hypothetical protein
VSARRPGASAAEACGWLGGFAARRTSSRVTRPAAPVPDTPARSTPVSCARRRATGVARGASREGADSRTGAAARASALSSIWHSVAPTLTTSPSATRILATTPAEGAGSSASALSVVISTRGWSSSTESPSLTSHWPTVASTTLSPSSGSFTSTAVPPSGSRRGEAPAARHYARLPVAGPDPGRARIHRSFARLRLAARACRRLPYLSYPCLGRRSGGLT